MTVLLENKTNDLETTRNALAAHVMAEIIKDNLLKEGNDRSIDGLTIKQSTQQATINLFSRILTLINFQ